MYAVLFEQMLRTVMERVSTEGHICSKTTKNKKCCPRATDQIVCVCSVLRLLLLLLLRV